MGPKWRWPKLNLWRCDAETGLVRSCRTKRLIKFSLRCTSLPSHLQEHEKNCLTCLACSLLRDMSLSMMLCFLSLEYCCRLSVCFAFLLFGPLIPILLSHELFIIFFLFLLSFFFSSSYSPLLFFICSACCVSCSSSSSFSPSGPHHAHLRKTKDGFFAKAFFLNPCFCLSLWICSVQKKHFVSLSWNLFSGRVQGTLVVCY